MLSRRSIRVKVMQLFYALNRDENLEFKDIKKLYNEWIDSSYTLLLFNIHCVAEICKFSLADAEKRKTKHLPQEFDLAFTPKLYENEFIQAIVNNKLIQDKAKSQDFASKLNMDYLTKIYEEFNKTEEYKKYVIEESTKENHLETILSLYRLCRSSELFNEMLDDNFYNWLDDKSLVVGAFKKYIKAQPTEDKFITSFYPDDETIDEFGRFLLNKTYENDEALTAKITPVIENWDHERVAILDMIMLKMGVTELLNCKSIPGKVTLNEYVEVSKKYSTPKSKEFINGVLDNMLKTFEENGEIEKEGRGLVE